jgi:hypothetical protein
MANSFEELKTLGIRRLRELRSLIRPDLGSHRRITLRRAGCEASGSLLHSDVAAAHSALLSQDYQNRLCHGSPKGNQDQLRFLTILHSVTALDKAAVLRAASEIEAGIHHVFESIGAWCLGAIEVEIVNLALLKRIGSLSNDETRKLNVLEKLSGSSDTQLDCGVLVHFHGVVDLVGNSLLREEKLRARLAEVKEWQCSPYQIELKRFFQKRSLYQNLCAIASYVTKGGNEHLRYNTGFGRDLPDDLDAKVWRAGSGRADKGGETVTDERALTLAEIALLDEVWLELMNKRQDERGYLIQVG